MENRLIIVKGQGQRWGVRGGGGYKRRTGGVLVGMKLFCTPTLLMSLSSL